MPTTTARLGIPTPLLAEAADVPASTLAMAQALDNLAIWGQGTLAARPAASGATGRLYYATDNGLLYISTGTAWVTIGPSVTSPGSIGSAEIADNAVGATELADNAVDTNAIINLAVTTGKLADGSVTEPKLAAALKPSGGAGAATEALRALGLGVGQAMPGNQSIVTTQIGDGQVTLAKHAADSVDASKIVDGSVGSAEIADGSVGSAELGANAVTDAKVADGALSAKKLDSIMGRVAANGSISAGTGFTINKTATGRYTVTFTSAFSAIPCFLCTCQYDAITLSSYMIVNIISISTTTAVLAMNDNSTSNGQARDTGFHFWALEM